MTLHVRYNFSHISLPFCAQLQREMIKLTKTDQDRLNELILSCLET